MVIGIAPGGRRRAPAPTDAGQPGPVHQPGDALAANVDALRRKLGVDAWRAVGRARSGVDLGDAPGQIGVGGRPRRGRPAAPGVIAGRRDLQDARHGFDRKLGLMRAHEPVKPFGFALLSRENQAAAFARMSRS